MDPEVSTDRSALIFKGQAVQGSLFLLDCLTLEDQMTQCNIPEDLNPQ